MKNDRNTAGSIRSQKTVEPLEARLFFAAVGLDPSFNPASDERGTNRIVIRHPALLDQANGMSVMADGKILLYGITGTREAGSKFALARLNADGTLDNTFGGAGTVIQQFGGSEASAYCVLTDEEGKPALLDGGLVVGGYGKGLGDFYVHFAMAKLDDSGELDPTFGTNKGKTLTDVRDISHAQIRSLMLRNGSIIAAGYAGRKFAVAKYTLNGVLDTSFGPDGTGTSVAPTAGYARGAVTLPNGNIVIVGNEIGANALLELFSSNGILLKTASSSLLAGASGVVVQDDGKLLVVGPSVPSTVNLDTDFAIARFNADLTPDTSFGGGDGLITFDLGLRENDEASSITLLPNGPGFLVGGSTNILRNVDGDIIESDFAVARFDADGTPVPTFETGTSATASFPLADFPGLRTASIGQAVAVQTDGNVLVAGSVPHPQLQALGDGTRGPVQHFGIARFRAGIIPENASVTGTCFIDPNRNGTRDDGEKPDPGRIVYDDRNVNGFHDIGEPSAVTGADGVYTLAGISVGPHSIRLQRGAFRQTLPADGYDITLGADEAKFGLDFGSLSKVTDTPPKAKGDKVSATRARPIKIDVLANDMDDRGLNESSVTARTQPAHGTISIDANDGRITYTPTDGFLGKDRFQYVVSDTAGHVSRPATVSISVTPSQGPLAIELFSVPAQVTLSSATATPVTFGVWNATNFPIGGSCTIELFLSGDSSIDETDPRVALVARPVKLKSGAGKSMKLVISSFPDVEGGTYQLIPQVTTPDGSKVVGHAMPIVLADPIANPIS